MDLSPIGEAVLIAHEGRWLKAYKDSVGIWTIGIGHTSAAGALLVTAGLTITSAQCDAIFECPTSAPVGQIEGLHERRMAGSS
ncbi:hypothetical protein ASF41_22970 [Methylobacterium sp. Leaf111]|nr:hypothetical protein ASF41_22970 [Methylobacterium sp. Leaf111]